MPPRESKKLLFDIQNAAQAVGEFTVGKSRKDYHADRLLRSAVERQFEIIGEALAQLAKGDTDTAAQITDHKRIIGFRNILIHGYAGVNDDVVWDIVEGKLSTLLSEVISLLDQD